MKTLWRWLMPMIGLGVLILPGAVFIGQRGSGFLIGRTQTDAMLVVFPLIGLYAFTFLWIQFMLGSLMPWWRQVYPGIERWHRTEGIFVFLFAVTHPTLLLLGVGLRNFTFYNFISSSMLPYVLLGEVGLLLLTLTVVTALLRKHPRVKRWWRQIHILNYATFVFVWIHSWNLGSDVQSTGLRWLWIGFGLSAVGAILLRVFGLTWPQRQAAQPKVETGTGSHAFVPVAQLNQIQPGQPFCAKVDNKNLALFRVGDQVYALENACPHMGGSLCQGSLAGDVIECPLHYSRFNVISGAYIDGPASRPAAPVPVRVQNGMVEVSI